MVTCSASHGLPGLEPAGQRLLLAAARLSYDVTAFLADLKRWSRSATGRTAALFALIAGAYAVGAELAWHHFSSGLAFGYPPSGVDVAALLLVARRRWLVVIAAIVVTEVGVDLQHHLTLAVALASALANAVEPVTGASFVRRFCAGRRPDLGTRTGLSWFVLGAAVLGPVVGGLVGATVSWADKGGWWPGLVLQWWAGDGIAVLVVGGTVLLWAQRRALVSARWLELVLVVLLATGLSVVAFRFGHLSSPPFLPVLAWAALRLRDLGVVLTGAAYAVVANYMTAAGYGEFAHLGLSSPASVAVTQAYIALVVLVGWVLAQEVAGRVSAVQDRDSARLERAMAEARREAAELGAVLADAATVRSVGDQVSAAVRVRLGAAQVVLSGLAADGCRFEPLAGGDAAAPATVMSAEWTIDSDAPGPRAVRDRTAVYLACRDAPGAGMGSMAALPLLTEAGALGYLGVWWAGPREVTAVEREYLRSVAETTSRALERARLRESERREHARAEALAAFLQGITQVLGGHPEAGDVSFQSAVSVGEAGAPDVIAEALCERSLLAMKRGNWAQAETFAGQAGTLLSRTGAEDAFAAAVQARVALHRGDVSDARQHMVSAQRWRIQFTYAYPHVAVQAGLELIRAYLALADFAAARALIGEIDDMLTGRPGLGTLVGEAEALRAQLARARGSRIPGEPALTAAELRLLPLLCTHRSVPEIAAEMSLSPATIRTQVSSIYRKLGVSSRSQAVTRARKLGLVER
ncbi:MAG TPA: MASE1 domain-containing protein [Streptosporangiaceae bacterium]|nr:MASE1 domain-containing protein [Streptosporangiaceae bacterium]